MHKKKKIILLSVIGYMLLGNSFTHGAEYRDVHVDKGYVAKELTSVEGPEAFIEESKRVIQQRPASYESLYNIFEPLLHPEVKTLFESYFTIMFNPDFPPPVHNDHVIINGYQCLYRKMIYAHTLKIEDEQKEYQEQALYKLLAFHKTSISKFNLDLGSKIPAFGCAACKQSAQEGLGILGTKKDD